MVIDSLAFNLTQVLHRVLALTVGICSKDLFPLQRIAPSPPHVFRELSLRPYKKAKLLFLVFPLGTWIPVICTTLFIQCRSEFALKTSPVTPSPFLPQPDPMEKSFRESRNSVSH